MYTSETLEWKLRNELKNLENKLEITIKVLKEIANEDFRENRSSGSVKAYNCLKDLKND